MTLQTLQKRKRVTAKESLEAVSARVLFLKSLCTIPTTAESVIVGTKLESPDHQNADPGESFDYFMKHIQQYEFASEIVNDTEHCSHIK